MTDFDRSTELIVELAKAVVIEMRETYPGWKEAFIRMQADVGFFQAKCSFVVPTGVQILNVMAHKAFMEQVKRIGAELRLTLEHQRPFCVAILRIGADLNYGMQYEYSDPDRWSITKINGGTGMPTGYTRA